jgi:hypothetical protein
MVPNWRQLYVVASIWGSYLVCPFFPAALWDIVLFSAYVLYEWHVCSFFVVLRFHCNKYVELYSRCALVELLTEYPTTHQTSSLVRPVLAPRTRPEECVTSLTPRPEPSSAQVPSPGAQSSGAKDERGL